MTDPAYSKGYAAGRKKTEAEMADVRAALDEEYRRDRDFRRAVFLAVLPEIIRAPWQTDGKRHTTAMQMVDMAVTFASEASKRLPK